MSKRYKKSQAAMEFLLTYGWAILVVLIVMGALAYSGVLDPSMLLPDRCTLQIGPLDCADHAVYVFPTGYGHFYLHFRNLFDNPIRIKSIEISRGEFKCNAEYTHGDNEMTVAGSSTGCIAMSCSSIPRKNKKEGFDLKMTYSSAGSELDKGLEGSMIARITELESVDDLPECLQAIAPGDGNGDGVINPVDYDIITNIISNLPDERVFDISEYDLNNNGIIGPEDRALLQGIIIYCDVEDRIEAISILKSNRDWQDFCDQNRG